MSDTFIDQDTSGQNPSTTNPPTEDPFSKEIDNIFGSTASDVDEGGMPPVKEPGNPDPFKGTDPNQPDYGNMDPEQVARMFQSKYDKTQAALDKVQERLHEYESLEEFIDSVYEDEDVKHAFLSEIAPDLVKQKDPYEALEEQLRKEFGEEYIPDDEEAKRPFTKSWKYYKRADDLEKSVKERKNVVPKSLKALREERSNKKKESQRQVLEEKNKVLTSMKWSDNDYNSFAQWVGKLSAVNLAKIYAYATSRSPKTAPGLVNQSGGSAPTPNVLMADLDKYFGK